MPLVVPILPVRGRIAVLPSPDGRIVSGLSVTFAVEVVVEGRPGQTDLLRLDTGAACSSMSLARAERLGLLRDTDTIAEAVVRTAGTGAKSTSVRLGRLPVRIPAVRDEPFEWPVLFHKSWPETHPTLLGLPGVVADLEIRFDGAPTLASEFGTVTLTPRTS